MGRWVGSMVGGWGILGLILVQLKLEIQLGQNFGLFSVSVGKITYKISVGVQSHNHVKPNSVELS